MRLSYRKIRSSHYFMECELRASDSPCCVTIATHNKNHTRFFSRLYASNAWYKTPNSKFQRCYRSPKWLKTWDARYPCTPLPHNSWTWYFIVSGEFCTASAPTAKAPRAYFRLLPLFYEYLGRSDIDLVCTFVRLSSPSPTRTKNGIMRQVHEMMTILTLQEIRSTFTLRGSRHGQKK